MIDNYKIFNAGIYLRLSQEDEREGQSESISNQQDFVTRHVLEQGWNVAGVYIDDGYSGLNFNRPDFKRMLTDIEKKKINLVITKDLSRLGRDYIDTGYYLERYFPKANVRYIALNDGIDTFIPNGNIEMSPFKAVINDMYAKDISKKVRTALHTKKLKGEFIGSVPPYGYAKDPADKGHLIIDPQTAPVVKRIYSMFINGGTKLGIANTLSKEGIPTPSQIKNLTATQKRHKGIWNECTISRILTTPTYIGNLTQNRAQKINYKIDEKINLPVDDWIIIENTHEPIISQDDFAMVTQIIKKRNYVKPDSKRIHLLSGLAKCGDCGGSMTFVNESPKRTYMVCATWRKHAKLGLCKSHSIRETKVEEHVINSLRKIADKHVNKQKVLEASSDISGEGQSDQKEIESCMAQLEQIKTFISNLYKDKVRGIITEQDFIEMSQNFHDERQKISMQLKRIENTQKVQDDMSKNSEFMMNSLENFLTFENVNRQTLALLVDKIEIFEGKKIKIHYNFSLKN